MDKNKVFDEVATLASQRFNIKKSQVTYDLSFTNDLGADFIDLAEFVVEIEDEFGDIPREESSNVENVGDLVTAIVANNRHKRIHIRRFKRR